MRHLKNYKLFESISDYVDEIKDIFVEYADKWDLSYVDGLLYDLYPTHNSYDVSVDGKDIIIFIYFDDMFGSAGIDGYLSEDFQLDMYELQNRIKNMGFSSEIDWEGGFCYYIKIKI